MKRTKQGHGKSGLRKATKIEEKKPLTTHGDFTITKSQDASSTTLFTGTTAPPSK